VRHGENHRRERDLALALLKVMMTLAALEYLRSLKGLWRSSVRRKGSRHLRGRNWGVRALKAATRIQRYRTRRSIPCRPHPAT